MKQLMRLMRQLLDRGVSVNELITVQIGNLPGLLARCSIQHDDDQRLLQRYLEIRREWGGLADFKSLAFVTIEGDQLYAERFDEYLQELRSIRINTQFNGEICRGLLRARYGTDRPKQVGSSVEVKLDFHPMADLQSTQKGQNTYD